MSIPADLLNLYAEFGIAAEKAQALEVDAGNVALAFLVLLVDRKLITVEQKELFQRIVDDVDRKTLGQLFKHVKKISELDATILSAVDDALEQRNYLTHRFFRTHNFAISSVEGRRLMVQELMEIQKKLDHARIILNGMFDTMIQLAGRSEQMKALAATVQEAGKKVDI